MDKNKKIKMLCWMDSPVVSTGFGSVAKGIFDKLAKTGKYDIDIIGINDKGGWKDPEKYPYRIYPAKTGVEIQGDYFGRPRMISTILGKDPEIIPPWDIIFVLNDPFILAEDLPAFNKGTLHIMKEAQDQFVEKLPPKYHFKTVYYIPIDSPIRGNWIENAVALADYPVAYTQYGKKEIETADNILSKPTNVSKRTDVIYHGVDMDIFKPIEAKEKKEFRDKFFKGVVYDHTFVVTVVARNQMRKDIPRTMAIFKEFQRRRPDSFLYLHCQSQDVWGNLQEYARNWNLIFGKDWGVPAKFNANSGFSINTLNKIYNASDVIISTSLGEGWGFYNSEAFATKTAVLAPNNTVHPEILGYSDSDDISDMDKLFDSGIRGIPYKAGSTLSEWATFGPDDLERVRPLGNVEDAVKKLVWIYDNPDKVSIIKDRAYEWIKKYTWDEVAKKWDKLFTDVYNQLEIERKKSLQKVALKASNKEFIKKTSK